MHVISSFYNDKIKEILLLRGEANNSSGSSGINLSQDDSFFMDPRVQSVIDEISELAIWVTKLPEVLGQISTFDHNKTNGGREAIRGTIPVIGFENILANGGSRSLFSLDWKSNEKLIFISHFLKSNNKEMKLLDSLVLEIVDYCIINDSYLAPNELLVFFHQKHLIQRQEFYTLGEPSEIMSSSIFDCWALLLNENQKYLKDGPRKLYFGSSISVTIVEAAGSDGNSQIMDNVYQDIFTLSLGQSLLLICGEFD
ncbi:uncharacterized protein LOC110737872 [Chenopodium quinoa]|uniref:uncharacterized protein LOC110737872 n=1 Tax=Chenopodium quinoa TaxID=63459 RepID=UPI000B77E4C7|nr:uncharacterized protein LOC110737872 [Chenopodium quinoa]